MTIRNFTFCVLAYNHEKYIIEHLESIKYLIENYGHGINIQLIINDDCSRDRTQILIDKWIEINKKLFFNVVKIYNKINLGTCASILNIISSITSDYFKLTAGDDVYSFENLFYFAPLLDQFEIVSGIPLDLTSSLVSVKRSDIIHIIASQIIYNNKTLLERFARLSNNNAPNMFYAKKNIFNVNVQNFLKEFRLVEDWPMQIAIAHNFKDARLHLVDNVFVYYRRTPGSIYIIENEVFLRDKKRAFSFLIKNENSLFKKIILRNRLFCMYINNNFLRRILNISLYIYVFSYLLYKRDIKLHYEKFVSNVDTLKHQCHYNNISILSSNFLEEHCQL